MTFIRITSCFAMHYDVLIVKQSQNKMYVVLCYGGRKALVEFT
jgi:hypothetical protein